MSPQKHLTQRDKLKILHAIGEKRIQELSPKLLTTQNLIETKSSGGNNCFFLTASNQQSQLLAPELFTTHALTSLSNSQLPLILYLIIINSEFDFANPNITEEVWRTPRPGTGETAFHYSAKVNNLYKIPSKFLTVKNLTITDNSKRTPLQIATQMLITEKENQFTSFPTPTLYELITKHKFSKRYLTIETIKKIKAYELKDKLSKKQNLIQIPQEI